MCVCVCVCVCVKNGGRNCAAYMYIHYYIIIWLYVCVCVSVCVSISMYKVTNNRWAAGREGSEICLANQCAPAPWSKQSIFHWLLKMCSCPYPRAAGCAPRLVDDTQAEDIPNSLCTLPHMSHPIGLMAFLMLQLKEASIPCLNFLNDLTNP